MPKRGPGRPRLPKKSRRSKTVQATVRDEEYDQIDRAAGADGVTISEWAREALLERLERKRESR